MMKKAAVRTVLLSTLLCAIPVPAQAVNKNTVMIAASALCAASGLYVLSQSQKAPTKKKRTASALGGLTLACLGIAALLKADKQAVTTFITKNDCIHGNPVLWV